MGANSSSAADTGVSISSKGMENCPPLDPNRKPSNITNNNLSKGIKIIPPNNGLKNDVIMMNGDDHHDDLYDKDSDHEESKFEWDNHVPLMDPMVVDMFVQKMEMMRKMKKMGGGHPPAMMMPNGQMPNGTAIDGKMPPPNGNLNGMMMGNGRVPPNGMHPNGMTMPNGMMPPTNGMPHPNGMMPPTNGMPHKMPPKFPKLMGSTENAVRIVRHMKSVFNSEEIQDLCDEIMDATDGNMMFKMMQCKLEMEFKFLKDLGMGHLVQLIATGKLPPILQLIFICYQDEPEVLQELAFVGPVFSKRPELIARKGDAVPNIILRTCSEEAVSLNDLHVNKNLPLVIFAASSS